MSALPAVVRDRGSQENFDALNKRVVEQKAGSVTLTWPGGSKATNELTVEHLLKGAPKVTATPSLTGVVVAVRSKTGTTFKVKAETTGAEPAAETTVSVDWIAVL